MYPAQITRSAVAHSRKLRSALSLSLYKNTPKLENERRAVLTTRERATHKSSADKFVKLQQGQGKRADLSRRSNTQCTHAESECSQSRAFVTTEKKTTRPEWYHNGLRGRRAFTGARGVLAAVRTGCTASSTCRGMGEVAGRTGCPGNPGSAPCTGGTAQTTSSRGSNSSDTSSEVLPAW